MGGAFRGAKGSCGWVAGQQDISYDASRGDDPANKIHEVVPDQANDLKAVRDDPGLGEVSSDQSAIGAAQIHADDADLFFAFEGGELASRS